MCQVCNKSGHIATNCFYRIDRQYTGNSGSLKSNDTAYAGMIASPTTLTDWYLDSGASSQITSNPNHVEQPTGHNGKTNVIVGNGESVDSIKLGNSCLKF